MRTFAPCFSLTKAQSFYLTSPSNCFIYFSLAEARRTQSFDFLIFVIIFVLLALRTKKFPLARPLRLAREKISPCALRATNFPFDIIRKSGKFLSPLRKFSFFPRNYLILALYIYYNFNGLLKLRILCALFFWYY